MNTQYSPLSSETKWQSKWASINFDSSDKKSNKYEEGVSCPRCYDTLTSSQKSRFRMRQSQINVAKKVGRKHKFQKEF